MTYPWAAAAALSCFLCAQPVHAAPSAEAPTGAPAPVQAVPLPAAAEGPTDAMVAVDGGDDHLLFGSYLRPEGPASYPALLIVPAQGLDRDGNAPGAPVKANSYRQLARALAARGVATLRIDKRGVGGSAKAVSSEEDLRFSAYVDDAVAWVRFLKAQAHVRCVAILGHSEGALTAALAAQKVKVCAIVEVAGFGRPAAAVLAQQLKSAADSGALDQGAYEQASHILGQLAEGKPAPDAPMRLSALFRPSVQPYLISWLDLDPIAALRTDTPVLILQGTEDSQVTGDDAQRLAAVPKTAKLVMIKGADHDLMVSPPDDKIVEGVDSRRIAPDAVAAIADFLARAK